MRTNAPGTHAVGGAIRLVVEGREVAGIEGDTLAAALVDAGELTCRSDRAGDPRGLFCGMGICQECVMLVDGVPMRTCMTPARDGASIGVLTAGAAAPRRQAPALEHATLEADVLVVGGGAAGLAAAASAAEAGVRVLLVDERSKLGGQYYKQPSGSFALAEADAQYRRGRALVERALAAGVAVETGAEVWAATSPHLLHAVTPARALTLRPRRLVIASGAYERGLPLPGWTLPGFMTTGAAQTLLRASHVLPGARVLLSGNGPLNVQVAGELLRAGAAVVALCETARKPSARHLVPLMRMGTASPRLVAQGAGYLRTLHRAGVPVLHRHAVVSAEGDGRVERATVARLDSNGMPVHGSERTFDVDAVCAGFGFLPSNELARALGAAHRFDRSLRHLVCVRSRTGHTTIDGVWVVGDCGGIRGARVAEAEGTLAGAAAAASLGAQPPPSLRRRVREAERQRRRGERFQRGLNRLYAAPPLADQLAAPETLICRCEEVPLAAVAAELHAGSTTSGAVKRVTRAGMGRCQGRYCGPLLVELAAHRAGNQPDELSGFAPAPPFRPLPAAVIAAAATPTPGAPA